MDSHLQLRHWEPSRATGVKLEKKLPTEAKKKSGLITTRVGGIFAQGVPLDLSVSSPLAPMPCTLSQHVRDVDVVAALTSKLLIIGSETFRNVARLVQQVDH